ncbi:MAG: hypothetical protein ACRYGK_00880 [Janthinobacterium lividum]
MLKRPDIALPVDPASLPTASYSAPVAPARVPVPAKTASAPSKSPLADPLIDPAEDETSAAPADHDVTSTRTAVLQSRIGRAGTAGAMPAEEGLRGDGGLMPERRKRSRHSRHGADEEGDAGLGALFAFDDDERESNVINGVGDRSAHLALKHGATQLAARIDYPARPVLDKSLPASRAACERRCGSDGFCDPSNPLGCGGLHCIDMQ